LLERSLTLHLRRSTRKRSKDMPKLNNLRFKRIPACELMPGEIAEHFTFRRGKWLFVSTEAPEDLGEYHFEIADFFKSPAATVDWLAHLSEKEWFEAKDFLAMMHRDETYSFKSSREKRYSDGVVWMNVIAFRRQRRRRVSALIAKYSAASSVLRRAESGRPAYSAALRCD
jgi:hypothetical protein